MRGFWSGLLLFFALGFQSAFGQEYGENFITYFAEHSPDSPLRINHQPLSDYLENTVLPVGRSRGFLGGGDVNSYIGSRIKTSGSLSPARFEGSRLLLHSFSDEHIAFFRAYKIGLERLAARRSLREFNQSEQAAYWLNLYNVIVINKLLDEYPISNLKSLRSEKKKKKSFWTQKVTEVEGYQLSLSDIETILFTNFDSPLLAFGLWQGSIGGPRLPDIAFTGRNVWQVLNRNATEFINSNRGLRPSQGSKLRVSIFFDWTIDAFGGNDDGVLNYIKEMADPSFTGDLSGVNSVSYKEYDWIIADLVGGSRHSGSISQLGGLQTSVGGGDEMKTLGGRFNPEFVGPIPSPGGDLPESTAILLRGIQMHTRSPIPIITVEECAPEEVCIIEDIDFEKMFDQFQVQDDDTDGNFLNP